MNPKVSVVVTVYNEEDNVVPLLNEIRKSLNGFSYEVVFVDDGSKDQTVPRLKKEGGTDLRVVEFTRNFGQTAAMAAGIEYARGELIVTMDGDLQNDPSDIPMMIRKLEAENLDLVVGRRKNRQDGMLLRKIPSAIANSMIRWLTGVYVYDYGCSLRVFRERFAKGLDLYGEMHRFIPVLAARLGARTGEVDVHHRARKAGQSKYGLSRTMRVLADLVFIVFLQKYFRRPSHIFGTLGLLSFGIGGLINIYLLISRLTGHDIWGRPLLILGMLLTLGGIQFVTFGILSEILMRVYFESQGKRPFLVRDVFETVREKRSV